MGFSISWKEYLHLRRRGLNPHLAEVERFIYEAYALTDKIRGAIDKLEALTAGSAEAADAFKRLNEAW